MPIQHHNCHIELEDNAILWRYMCLPKLESILKERALFFCRADKFSDPYEFSIPKREFEFRLSPACFAAEMSLLNRTDINFDAADAKKRADDLAATHKKVATATTVNCWQISSNESNSMWQTYLKDNEGIAIRTSKQKLYKSLENVKENIGISKVRYINYDNDIWYHPTEYPEVSYNFYTPVIHKRIEFEHERELRLYHHDHLREKDGFWNTQANEKGELIAIDVSTLVESIIFHPTADDNTKKKIVALTKAYEFDFKFESSRLSIEPSY